MGYHKRSTLYRVTLLTYCKPISRSSRAMHLVGSGKSSCEHPRADYGAEMEKVTGRIFIPQSDPPHRLSSHDEPLLARTTMYEQVTFVMRFSQAPSLLQPYCKDAGGCISFAVVESDLLEEEARVQIRTPRRLKSDTHSSQKGMAASCGSGQSARLM